MKKVLLLLLVVCFGFSFLAETTHANSNYTVTSDSRYFDPAKGLYFLSGNVYVSAKGRSVTANEATFDPTSLQVWAKGNVTFKQSNITMTGDSVYVIATQRRAEVSGNLHFIQGGVSITGNSGDYNWKSKIATFKGNVVVNNNGQINNYDYIQYNVVENRFL